MQIEIRKHYIITLSALFFLGFIMAKPGMSFNPVKEVRVCKINKGKMSCDSKKIPKAVPGPIVQYVF